MAVSALAVVANDPVLAKPQNRSKVVKPIVTSQAGSKVVVDDAISPQPVEAILANIRLKPSPAAQPKRTGHQKVVTAKSVTAVVTPHHVQADRSAQGIDRFIDTNQAQSQSPKSKSSGIDRWID